MTNLTDRQRAVLTYITDYIDVRHKPPTVREIQANFGFRSPSTVTAHLNALERKGKILRTPGESRNIEPSNTCTI